MFIERRRVILGTAAIAATASVPRVVFGQGAAGPFKIDPLPYPTNALEPHIDARTMEIHHDRHHQAYVTNLNTVAKDDAEIGTTPLHELLGHLADLPDNIRTVVRNNGGGHANHTMFWQIMGPGGGAPEGDLFAAITRDFGGLDT